MFFMSNGKHPEEEARFSPPTRVRFIAPRMVIEPTGRSSYGDFTDFAIFCTPRMILIGLILSTLECKCLN